MNAFITGNNFLSCLPHLALLILFMKKIFALLLFFIILSHAALAIHGKGGTLMYEYLGPGSAGKSRYKITVKHYIDCGGTQFIEPTVHVGVFDAASKTLFNTFTFDEKGRTNISKLSFNPCINPVPIVCYVVVDYYGEVELPDNEAGYILTDQECCRISGIINIQNSSTYGLTSTGTIPGVINGVTYRTNSSPVFAQKDTAVICYKAPFVLDFSATDKDGDSLVFAFCPAITGGNSSTRQPNPPPPPPYTQLIYQNGFTASQPLGPQVNIDTKTGIISGIAPAQTGSYVIAVSVTEYRKGVQIGTSKKEFQLTIAACNLTAASLKPTYINCKDFGFTFQNETPATNITNYLWDFGVPGTNNDTSTISNPTYVYSDTGTYRIKLRVSSSMGCADSAFADVKVYPGFKPDFESIGRCYQTPFQFNDASTARYGTVSSWQWSFGDGATSTSTEQNPTYQFSGKGTYDVKLVVGSTKGCQDSITKSLAVDSKPLLVLPFKDTLICSIDTLAIPAQGSGGNFTWTPAASIVDPSKATALVFPKDTTTYIVTLNELGCVTQDTVTVNVLDYITVALPADTVICKGDTIQLRPESHALQYLWSPSDGLDDQHFKNPFAAPQQTTTYQVIANLGKCQSQASITVKVVPYPSVQVGADTTICFGQPAQLSANVLASSFSWSPIAYLTHANTLNPIATPPATIRYVLTVKDTLGCPKPVSDTVFVNVMPEILANAGHDTSVVINQPLQLTASGGSSYVWQPGQYLTNTQIANPIARFPVPFDAYRLQVLVYDDFGCYDSAFITVKVYKTLPTIYVPTAFTPNNDGKNDILRPITAGMQRIEYFRIYNRWGQMVYQTSINGNGWDGKINGQQQKTDVYVWEVKAIDYLGAPVVKKGTATLVR